MSRKGDTDTTIDDELVEDGPVEEDYSADRQMRQQVANSPYYIRIPEVSPGCMAVAVRMENVDRMEAKDYRIIRDPRSSSPDGTCRYGGLIWMEVDVKHRQELIDQCCAQFRQLQKVVEHSDKPPVQVPDAKSAFSISRET